MLCVAEQKQTLIDAKRSENQPKTTTNTHKVWIIIRITYFKGPP